MMHPSEQELLAFEDGERMEPAHAGVLAHLARCGWCAARLAVVRQDGLRRTALLSVLDHRVPRVSVDMVIARARRSTAARWRPLIAAGVGMMVLAGAAAAAVPGSALRQYFERVLAASPFSVPRRSPPASVAAPAPGQAAASGIAFVPASTVDVMFRDVQSVGAIHITLRDTRLVRLEHSSGGAGYMLTGTGVVVENTGSRASYVMALPRTGSHLLVRVGQRAVFSGSDRDITTVGTKDSTGSYVIEFTQLKRHAP